MTGPSLFLIQQYRKNYNDCRLGEVVVQRDAKEAYIELSDSNPNSDIEMFELEKQNLLFKQYNYFKCDQNFNESMSEWIYRLTLAAREARLSQSKYRVTQVIQSFLNLITRIFRIGSKSHNLALGY